MRWICCANALASMMLDYMSSMQALRPITMASSSIPRIDLIVTDVDGTLLDSKQQLSPKVEEAVKRAAAVGVPLIVATGKARGPWVHEVFPRLEVSMPGVFLQGLLIYDSNGMRMYQRSLDYGIIADCTKIAHEQGVTLTGYAGERIIAAEINEQTDRLKFYKEPDVEAVGPLPLVMDKIAIQKLIFMAPQSKIDAIRPSIEQQLAGRASITTAIEGMLEVLPLGASKGAGIAWLLDRLRMDPRNVMAIGDGENDMEMLQLVGLGVAMGNAGPALKHVADQVVASNDENGLAEAIEKFVLQPREQAVAAAAAASDPAAAVAHSG